MTHLISSATTALFTSVALGAFSLPHRAVMSPMTRLRTEANLAPSAVMADYYEQRASAALIISETIAVAPYGDGYPPIPGIYSEQQINAWREITGRVHAKGGLMVAQLWHVGRLRFDQEQTRAPGWVFSDPLKPHDLSAADINALLEGFKQGARAARAAGFDGVEIHNGNGFLLDQFLRSTANSRIDQYGGAADNRIRLLLQIIAAVESEWPSDRIGVRCSPSATVDGQPDPEALATFTYLLRQLSPLNLAYLHLTRAMQDDQRHGSGPGIALKDLRSYYTGNIIGAGDFTQDEGERAITEGWLDAVAYGRLFLANPDLPERFAAGADLNEPDHSTFYGAGEAGLTTYPRMAG